MRCSKCDRWCKKPKAILCKSCWREVDDSAETEIEKPITVKREATP